MQKLHTSPSLGRALVILMLVVVTLTACSASTSTPNISSTQPATSVPLATTPPTSMPLATTPPTSMPQNTASPIETVSPTATSAPQSAAVTTQLDPCQLITSQEASSLTGASFGQGTETTTPGGLKICTYGSQTTNVFNVDVAQAADIAAAQADQAQFLADIQANLKTLTSQGLNITQDPTFADGAIMANIGFNSGGIDISGNSMGFRKGTIFVGFSDLALGSAAPTDAAMKAEASTVLARLP